MIDKSKKYSLILFSLGIVSLVLSLLLFNGSWRHESQWLLSLSVLLLLGQIILFFILNRTWILSAIVAAHIVLVIYLFYAASKDSISSIFSPNYLLFSDVYLPLLTILLIYLIQRGPILTNLKRNASAMLSIISVSLIHFLYMAAAAAASG